jgi:hypothetical protein
MGTIYSLLLGAAIGVIIVVVGAQLLTLHPKPSRLGGPDGSEARCRRLGRELGQKSRR